MDCLRYPSTNVVVKLLQPGVTASQIRGIVKGDSRGRLPFLRNWLAGRLDAAALDMKPSLFEANTTSHQFAPLLAHRNAAKLALAAAAAAELPARDFLMSDQPTARQYLIEGLPEIFPSKTLIAWLVRARADGDADLACAWLWPSTATAPGNCLRSVSVTRPSRNGCLTALPGTLTRVSIRPSAGCSASNSGSVRPRSDRPLRRPERGYRLRVRRGDGVSRPKGWRWHASRPEADS